MKSVARKVASRTVTRAAVRSQTFAAYSWRRFASKVNSPGPPERGRMPSALSSALHTASSPGVQTAAA